MKSRQAPGRPSVSRPSSRGSQGPSEASPPPGLGGEACSNRRLVTRARRDNRPKGRARGPSNSAIPSSRRLENSRRAQPATPGPRFSPGGQSVCMLPLSLHKIPVNHRRHFCLNRGGHPALTGRGRGGLGVRSSSSPTIREPRNRQAGGPFTLWSAATTYSATRRRMPRAPSPRRSVVLTGAPPTRPHAHSDTRGGRPGRSSVAPAGEPASFNPPPLAAAAREDPITSFPARRSGAPRPGLRGCFATGGLH